MLFRSTDPDNAFGYELKESGEEGLIGAWLNQNRSLDRPFVFLDAGANRGDWTTCLMGQAQIDVVGHCFEPSPTMFKRLTDRVAEASTPHTNVQCYNVGLSDEEGTFPMRIFTGYEGVNSFLTDSGFWDSTYVDSRIRHRRLRAACRGPGSERVVIIGIRLRPLAQRSAGARGRTAQERCGRPARVHHRCAKRNEIGRAHV